MSLYHKGEKISGGSAGKSAYQAALDGGYKGTESEFNELLANLKNGNNGSTSNVALTVGNYTLDANSLHYAEKGEFYKKSWAHDETEGYAFVDFISDYILKSESVYEFIPNPSYEIQKVFVTTGVNELDGDDIYMDVIETFTSGQESKEAFCKYINLPKDFNVDINHIELVEAFRATMRIDKSNYRREDLENRYIDLQVIVLKFFDQNGNSIMRQMVECENDEVMEELENYYTELHERLQNEGLSEDEAYALIINYIYQIMDNLNNVYNWVKPESESNSDNEDNVVSYGEIYRKFKEAAESDDMQEEINFMNGNYSIRGSDLLVDMFDGDSEENMLAEAGVYYPCRSRVVFLYELMTNPAIETLSSLGNDEEFGNMLNSFEVNRVELDINLVNDMVDYAAEKYPEIDKDIINVFVRYYIIRQKMDLVGGRPSPSNTPYYDNVSFYKKMGFKFSLNTQLFMYGKLLMEELKEEFKDVASDNISFSLNQEEYQNGFTDAYGMLQGEAPSSDMATGNNPSFSYLFGNLSAICIYTSLFCKLKTLEPLKNLKVTITQKTIFNQIQASPMFETVNRFDRDDNLICADISQHDPERYFIPKNGCTILFFVKYAQSGDGLKNGTISNYIRKLDFHDNRFYGSGISNLNYFGEFDMSKVVDPELGSENWKKIFVTGSSKTYFNSSNNKYMYGDNNEKYFRVGAILLQNDLVTLYKSSYQLLDGSALPSHYPITWSDKIFHIETDSYTEIDPE